MLGRDQATFSTQKDATQSLQQFRQYAVGSRNHGVTRQRTPFRIRSERRGSVTTIARVTIGGFMLIGRFRNLDYDDQEMQM